jgi:S-adenosylmethionine:tRNA ribosyltransferase-isomerase
MKRTDFAYELPPNLIAQEPRERGRSRMMVVSPREGAEPRIEHDSFASLPDRLVPGDVLVINDTRVIPARLFAKPKAGMSRPIEILLTRRLTEAQTRVSVPHGSPPFAPSDLSSLDGVNDVAQTLLSVQEIWEAWCKPAKRVKVGDELIFSKFLRGRVLGKNEGTVTIAFESDRDVDEEIERIGIPPLPPYIAR